MNPVETLLRRLIGLDVNTVGASTVDRALRTRMKSLGLLDVTAYLAHARTTPAEWEEFLESVVVTETWFFRDETPFKAFVQLVQSGAHMPSDRPFRILSVPCSTGEEPYSIAMALLDAGISREQFVIDAVDISGRALDRARAGVYGKNSFRGEALEFRERHFTSAATGFVLAPQVRDCVSFQRANILDEPFLTGGLPYDFIFCRNLLIYFDRATQRRTLEKLHRLLSPTGILFVGPAEVPLVSNAGFVPIGLAMAFACRKGDRKSPRSEKQSANPRPTVSRASLPAISKMQTGVSLVEPGVSPIDDRLGAARALANAGKLAEAAHLCETLLKENGPTAEIYYLLGLVRDASGDPAALACYRKALYLEPTHYETLMQMALLLEREGDASAAQSFRRRAARQLQKLEK